MTDPKQTTHSPGTASVGSPPLQGERVAFTGTLASMTHQQAMQFAEQYGGTATAGVSRKTTMLVVGEEGWPLEQDGQPSQKLRQVNEWNAQGGECRILKESDWLFLVGLEDRRREIRGEHTPAMLSRLLNVPANEIRGWARIGLIRPVRTVGRLPFFDFQEVSGARRIAELLAAGVTDRELKRGFHALKSMLPGIERPLSQLQILARDSRLLYRDERGLVEPATRQRRFDFDSAEDDTDGPDGGPGGAADEPDATVKFEAPEPDTPGQHSRRSPSEWFDEGCRRLDADDAAAAAECFRMSLMDRPGDAETQFCLAEALYRLGNTEAALERYYAAVECDNQYLEALTQIGVLHIDLDQFDAACDAFNLALNVHPEYPEAHWHLANLLAEKGRHDEARPHWQAYLAHDSRSPWAETARQQLASAAGNPST